MRRFAVPTLVLVAGCGTILGLTGDDEEPIGPSPSATTDAANDTGTGVGPGGDATTNVNDDSGAVGDAAKDAVAPPRRRAVFVSQKSMNGSFGGLAGGDDVCNAEANDAGLGGGNLFVAWLSTDSIGAKSRLVADAGWYLVGVDAGVVFSGPSAIAYGSFPKVPIDRNARGQVVPDGGVWTGTRADGTTYSSSCNGWTSTGATGVPGYIGKQDETWTGAAPAACTDGKRLICFEK